MTYTASKSKTNGFICTCRFVSRGPLNQRHEDNTRIANLADATRNIRVFTVVMRKRLNMVKTVFQSSLLWSSVKQNKQPIYARNVGLNTYLGSF